MAVAVSAQLKAHLTPFICNGAHPFIMPSVVHTHYNAVSPLPPQASSSPTFNTRHTPSPPPPPLLQFYLLSHLFLCLSSSFYLFTSPSHFPFHFPSVSIFSVTPSFLCSSSSWFPIFFPQILICSHFHSYFFMTCFSPITWVASRPLPPLTLLSPFSSLTSPFS